MKVEKYTREEVKDKQGELVNSIIAAIMHHHKSDMMGTPCEIYGALETAKVYFLKQHLEQSVEYRQESVKQKGEIIK